MQAKDIPDESIIAAIRAYQDCTPYPAHIWHITKALPDIPEKVIMAKLRSMKRRGVIWTGCMCGCRGHFELPDHPNSKGLLTDPHGLN